MYWRFMKMIKYKKIKNSKKIGIIIFFNKLELKAQNQKENRRKQLIRIFLLNIENSFNQGLTFQKKV